MTHAFGFLPEGTKTRLATRVRDVDFSVRTHNTLTREKIIFVGDLVQYSESDLLRMWGFGRKSLNEVKRYLAPDLRLGMKLSEWSHDAALALESRMKAGQMELADAHAVNYELALEPEATRRDLESLGDGVKARLAVRLKDVAFSARTHNALRKAGLIFVGDVVQLSERAALQIQGFGRKSLAEVKRFLDPDLLFGMTLNGWSREAALQLERRFRGRNSETRRREFVRILRKGGPIDSLNEELRRFAAVYSRNQHQADIVIALYGWDGTEAKTLEDVGQRFGITRERVRQIVASFRSRMGGVKLHLEWLRMARQEIIKHIPATQLDVERALEEAGVTRGPFRISGIIAALELVGWDVQFACLSINGVALIVQADQLQLPRQILTAARRSVGRLGCSNVDDVADEVAKDTGAPCPTAVVLSVLKTEPGFQSLGDQWFWFSTVRRNRLLNTLQKIFAVSPKISLGELRTALRRHPRMSGVSAPQRVLGELVARLPGSAIEGDAAVCKSPLSVEKTLSPLELKFYHAFQENGPVLRLDDLERILLSTGVNRTSFYIYLGNSPLITRLRVAVYALVGTDIPPGLLDDPQLAPPQRKLFAGSGWCKGGEVWLAYRLTYSNLTSGAFGIPTAFRDLLQGTYGLSSDDGGEFGTVTVRDTFIYGLAKFFARRGGEPDDYVVLLVNLDRRIVTALLGDAELVERFETGEDLASWHALDQVLEDGTAGETEAGGEILPVETDAN